MKVKKYEFYLFDNRPSFVEEQTEKLQNEGWELAGSITPYIWNGTENYVMIPFKREIK